VQRLRAGGPWPQAQAAILANRSPQAMKLAWRLLQHGSGATDFAQEMRMEYRLAVRVVRRHDFQQGVRAVLLAKDNDPRWYPPTLDDTPDAVVESLFEPLRAIPEWSPL
jgi:enoyl-CoA hydratase